MIKICLCFQQRHWLKFAEKIMRPDLKQFNKLLKVRAHNFFSKLQPVPLLKAKAYLYHLFSEFPQEKKQVESHKKQVIPSKVPKRHEIIELANSQTEIDLHIEQLVSDP